MCKICMLLLCCMFQSCNAAWHLWQDPGEFDSPYVAIYPYPKLDVNRDPVIVITPYDHKRRFYETEDYRWTELTNELIWDWHYQGGKFIYID